MHINFCLKRSVLAAKKVLILTIIALLHNCKSQQNLVEKESLEVEIPHCLLNDLPLTTDYKNTIENYITIYKDTVIEIESTNHELSNYKTLLELKASERYLWLVRVKEAKIDSFLVHCISPSKSVDIRFDNEQCEIEREEIKYDYDNGEPLSMTTQPFTIDNWLLNK